MRNSLSPNAKTINRYKSLILADRRLEMHFIKETGCAKSRNLWSKPEPEVVLAAILDAEESKSLENASKRPRKAIITDANETA